MSGISVSLAVLLIKGVPECLIVAWAIYVFTGTPFNVKNYLLLAGISLVATYLIRFLPITLGINTVLFLFVLIFAFQMIHKGGISMVIRTVISSVIILILIAVSELLYVLMTTLIYGREQAETLFRFSDELTRAFYAIPSNIFLALFVLAGYFIMKKVQKKRNSIDGKTNQTAGQEDISGPQL